MSEKNNTKDNTKENVHCSICYLQSVNSPEMKFHLYEESDGYMTTQDKFICQKCLDWIHFTRKAAAEQVRHPKTDPFQDIDWWWQPKKQGISASEMTVK